MYQITAVRKVVGAINPKMLFEWVLSDKRRYCHLEITAVGT